jgi:hypothetical protein
MPPQCFGLFDTFALGIGIVEGSSRKGGQVEPTMRDRARLGGFERRLSGVRRALLIHVSFPLILSVTTG